MKTYKRAISLKIHPTKSKRNKIDALIRRYRKQVNLFIDYIWNNKEIAKLDGMTFNSVTTIQNLSIRYKSSALNKALTICNKAAKSKPKFDGFPILDKKFVSIIPSKTSKIFDLWIRISTLKKGKLICIPSKKHNHLNYWLSRGNLIQGCELRPTKIIVWVDCSAPEINHNQLKIGVDIGMNKLITTNYGTFHGINFNQLNEKILRKKKNSNSYKRALIEKKHYINQSVNELPWSNLALICYENLKNLKKGKKHRNIKLRQKQQYWSYRQVINAMKMKAQQNRVRLCYVNPAYTSQMCSSCGIIVESNRVAEIYSCSCGHLQDADVNGARNILNKGLDWIGSLKSPKSKKS